ncbi:(deoxy)nucleoside triphosphate pyrophosphohydrolase [Mailhella massiliensis]|uniref:(deoxy)nucleoside triphosphate pyrophosphohydrolase n=1 Tax=Mailhella massiliensis TaxID=1903261 RepID=UPI00097E025E|nr:(deoxy)nucleoside triphosphate pyrophosphohydrolase [Mailhella massiliensis]
MEKVTKEVMGAVFFEQGRILVMRRAPFMSCAGSWEFPGGKLEKGESHEQCLARELREELGIEAQIGGFLTENSHEYDFGTVHLCVYRVLSWTGDMALTVHDDMRWVPLHELAVFPGLLPADVPVARKLEKILG